jgi:hypothetical protein
MAAAAVRWAWRRRLAINVSRSDAVAEIPSGITITAGGLLTLESSNNMDASALADGSATEGSIDTAIGVAVAINVAHMTNLATVAGGANVTAEGVHLSAAMKDVGGDRRIASRPRPLRGPAAATWAWPVRSPERVEYRHRSGLAGRFDGRGGYGRRDD